jgi:phage terminase large subunit GpA-like protein
MVWVKTSQRNEALDCAVYARAAVAVLRPNFRQIARNLFKAIEEQRAKANPAPAQVNLGAPAPVPEKPAPAKVPDAATQIKAAMDEVKAQPEDSGRPRPAYFSRPRRAPGFVSGWHA